MGEICRRIVRKAVLFVIHYDVQEAAGSVQLCAGWPAGCEESVHAVRTIFSEAGAHGLLLADANNAFNCLNRQLTLVNIHHLCPSLSNILINTYRSDVQLFTDREHTWSREGTIQGDPLTMPMLAIGIVPLITHLCKKPKEQINSNIEVMLACVLYSLFTIFCF